MVPSSSGTQFQRVQIPGQEFLEEEPLYVNAKQYKRILKRRQARAKLEAEGKIPKERPVSFFSFKLIVVDIKLSVFWYYEQTMLIFKLYKVNCASFYTKFIIFAVCLMVW